MRAMGRSSAGQMRRVTLGVVPWTQPRLWSRKRIIR